MTPKRPKGGEAHARSNRTRLSRPEVTAGGGARKASSPARFHGPVVLFIRPGLSGVLYAYHSRLEAEDVLPGMVLDARLVKGLAMPPKGSDEIVRLGLMVIEEEPE